jgi:hypothetical protein
MQRQFVFQRLGYFTWFEAERQSAHGRLACQQLQTILTAALQGGLIEPLAWRYRRATACFADEDTFTRQFGVCTSNRVG